MRWPGRIESGECDVPAITTDLFPTLLELAGLDALPAQTLDGCSLAKVLRRQADEAVSARVLGWHYPHHLGPGSAPSSAIREGNLKLIHWIDPEQCELFDLAEDPGEQRNLAAERPDDVLRLQTKLQARLQETLPSQAGGERNQALRPFSPLE